MTETQEIPSCAIIGVGPGLGLALAKRFCDEGFHLGLVARQVRLLENYARWLRQNGGLADGFPADVREEGFLRACLRSLIANIGVPDVLIYNAAALRQSNVVTVSSAEFIDDFRVNVVGALICLQEVAPAMKQRGGGTFLFSGGGLSLDPSEDYASLSVGKAGLRNLAMTAAKTLEPEGVRVATVTIDGVIDSSPQLSASSVADAFWRLYRCSEQQWTREIVYPSRS